MIIDVHSHAGPVEATEFLARRWTSTGAGAIGGGDHRPASVRGIPRPTPALSDPGEKLGEMAAKGIDGAVVSQAPFLYLYDADPATAVEFSTVVNGGLTRYCAAEPARLWWLAHVPLQVPEALEGAVASAAAAGAVGLSIGTALPGHTLDDEAFEPFWAAASSHDLPVLVHPTLAFNEPHSRLSEWFLQNVIGLPVETTVFAERIICSGVLDRHRDLRIVLAHGGGCLPYQVGRLGHARPVRPELAQAPGDIGAQFSRLYFDSITYDDDALAFLVRKVGADKVLLGSDHPFDMQVADPVASVSRAVSPQSAQLILHDNPVSVFSRIAR